jgi:energy-coupling factor transporter transmembrane protein EcfT
MDSRFPCRLLKSRAALVALFLVLGLLHAGHYAVSQKDAYVGNRVGDEASYHAWALEIAEGALVRGAPFFTTPLYAYFLGGVYSLAGPSIAIAAGVNLLLALVTLGLLYGAARQVLDRGLSALAVALYGVCSAPLFYETFPEKSTLVNSVVAAALLLMLRAFRLRHQRLWLAAGVGSGIAALGHGLLLAFIPTTLFCIVLQACRATWRRDVIASIVFLIGCGLGIAPATIHNYWSGGDRVLICSNGGHNLYIGNHAGNQTGLYTSPTFATASLALEESGFRDEAERRTGRKMRPSEVSSFWFAEGMKEARQDPGLAFGRWWRKLRWAVGNEELTDTRTLSFYRERLPVLGLPLPGFGAVALLGLLGIFVGFREHKLQPLVAFTVIFWGGISLFFVYGRYRLPLLPPLALLAAVFVGQIEAWRVARRVRPILVSLAAGSFLAWFVFGSVLPAQQESFFPDYFNQGNHYYRGGDVDSALQEYEKALFVRPGDHPAAAGLALEIADVYLKRRQPAKAKSVLERALSNNPEDGRLQQMLLQIQSSDH